MRLKPEEVERIVENILIKLKDKDLITFKSDKNTVKTKMIGIFNKNLEEEARIDEEAEQILLKFQNEIDSGEVDHRKMFLKVKKQLAKEKKFIL